MTDTASLEDGFYWVRDGGEWVVVRIDEGRVYFTGHDVYEMVTHIDEIDPRPIKREDVK